jgi:hypothetical protein
MIINAGMLMNEAGLVPPIIELIARAPKATPIPMAVEAFIASIHRLSHEILQSWTASMHKRARRRPRAPLPIGARPPGGAVLEAGRGRVRS